MDDERLRYIRNLQSLAPLHAHTDAINLDEAGRVTVNTKLSPPVDAYGIPRPEIMVTGLLSLMTTENYVWTGDFDEHHTATPKADFTVVRTRDEGDIGSAFRGLACLKILMPRQMHNFSHQIFELPTRPSVDVMRQAVTEVGHAKQLHDILDEYMADSSGTMTKRLRALCTGALHRKIESMQEPVVNMLPSREDLLSMELVDLRRTVDSLLKVRRFSKKHLIHPAIRKHQSRPSSPAGFAA